MKTIKIVGLVFLIVGLIFAIMGTNEYITSKQKIDERIYTEAVITRIERDHSSHNDGEILHDVFIQIEVEGKIIESKLNTYNSGMKVNDTISVYYYSDNLEYVYEVGSDEAMLLFPIIGGVFAIIGAIFLFSKKAQ